MSPNIQTQFLVQHKLVKNANSFGGILIRVVVYANSCLCIFTNQYHDSEICGMCSVVQLFCNNFVPILLSYFSHSFSFLITIVVLNLVGEIRRV